MLESVCLINNQRDVLISHLSNG